jgi:hypothetical protein
MTTAVWLSLVVLIVTPVACGGWATGRGFRAYRAAKHFARAANRAILPIQVAASVAEDRVASVEAGQVRLQEALVRLQRSQAELDVLRRAAEESRASLKGFTSLMPSK